MHAPPPPPPPEWQQTEKKREYKERERDREKDRHKQIETKIFFWRKKSRTLLFLYSFSYHKKLYQVRSLNAYLQGCEKTDNTNWTLYSCCNKAHITFCFTIITIFHHAHTFSHSLFSPLSLPYSNDWALIYQNLKCSYRVQKKRNSRKRKKKKHLVLLLVTT